MTDKEEARLFVSLIRKEHLFGETNEFSDGPDLDEDEAIDAVLARDDRIRAEERKRCIKRLRSAFFRDTGPHGYMSAQSDEDAIGECDALCNAILADDSASEPKLEEHDLYIYDDAKPLPKGEIR